MAQLSVSNLGGGKNLLINGGFDIWQRGTSFTTLSNNTYAADRWNLFTVASTHTVSRQAFTPGQTDVPGNPTYFMRLASSGSNELRLIQKIEAPGVLSGTTMTLSFWAKTTDGGSIRTIFATQDAFASGARADQGMGGGTTLDTTWRKITRTVTFPSITGKTVGVNTYASVEIYITLGNSVDIAQVQLEVGSVATPFEFRPFAEELALCQRYYEKSYDTATAPGSINIDRGVQVYKAGVVDNLGQILFKVTKRPAASINVVLYNWATGATASCRDISNSVDKSIAANGIGDNGFYWNNINTFTANSVMKWHWTADAEL